MLAMPNGSELILYACTSNKSTSFVPYRVRKSYTISSNATHLESGELYINASNDYYSAVYAVPIKNYSIFGYGVSTLTIILIIFGCLCGCFCFYI